MYYSAPEKGSRRQYLGAARAETPRGPFEPDVELLICRNAAGGVIDIAGFIDKDSNNRYIVYKLELVAEVDGVDRTNPQFIREVNAEDGTTFIGDETMINYRQDGDGFWSKLRRSSKGWESTFCSLVRRCLTARSTIHSTRSRTVC